MPSTPKPRVVSASATTAASASTITHSRSQDSGSFIVLTRPACRGVAALGRDPFVDRALEQRQWQGAVGQHHVVELLDVEPLAERIHRVLAQAQDLELADLVGARLAWGHDVTLDLGRDLG